MPRREQTIEEYFEATPSDDGWALRALCSLFASVFRDQEDVTLGMTDAGDRAPSFACTANTVALQLVIAEPILGESTTRFVSQEYRTVTLAHRRFGPSVGLQEKTLFRLSWAPFLISLAPDWAPADAVNLNCRPRSLSYPSGFARNLLESTEQIELQKEA